MEWMMPARGPRQWMQSHEVARRILTHRDNDIKVSIYGYLVPVENIFYDSIADSVIIDLIAGEDLRLAVDVTGGNTHDPSE